MRFERGTSRPFLSISHHQCKLAARPPHTGSGRHPQGVSRLHVGFPPIRGTPSLAHEVSEIRFIRSPPHALANAPPAAERALAHTTSRDHAGLSCQPAAPPRAPHDQSGGLRTARYVSCTLPTGHWPPTSQLHARKPAAAHNRLSSRLVAATAESRVACLSVASGYMSEINCVLHASLSARLPGSKGE